MSQDIKKRSPGAGRALQALWDASYKQAFWDRNVQYDDWKVHVIEGHPSYLPQSVTRLPVRTFIALLGQDAFIAHWPRLRGLLPAGSRRQWASYDMAWSQLVSGTFNVQPLTAWFDLSRRERAFLLGVAQQPGEGIYQVGKRLGMQYRRAHDHAKALISAGFIRVRTDRVKNRTVHRLYPY